MAGTDLKRHLAILGELTRTDLKVRFEGSVLGYVWTLLKPLVRFAVLYVVFTHLIGRSPTGSRYALGLLLGIIFWAFLADCTLVGMNAFLAKAHLVTKVRVPRAVIVMSSTMVSAVLLLLNLVVFFALYLGLGPKIDVNALFLVVYLMEMYVIGLGLTLALSVLLIRLRDMQHVWELALDIGFWFTPIVWNLGDVVKSAAVQRVIMLNPMARVIQFSKLALGLAQTQAQAVGVVQGEMQARFPGLKAFIALAVMTGVVFLAGYVIFKKQESHIAERL